jgi:hypothetical protein
MMPMLKDMERVQGLEMIGSPEARGAIGMAKLSAGKAIPLVRSLLFPEDDDG